MGDGQRRNARRKKVRLRTRPIRESRAVTEGRPHRRFEPESRQAQPGRQERLGDEKARMITVERSNGRTDARWRSLERWNAKAGSFHRSTVPPLNPLRAPRSDRLGPHEWLESNSPRSLRRSASRRRPQEPADLLA